jgi:bacterioferritin-associated ferredoxin
MYVCVCNSVTESDIRSAVDNGVHNMKQLRRATRCSNTCGKCEEMAVEILQLALTEKRRTRNLLPVLQIA